MSKFLGEFDEVWIDDSVDESIDSRIFIGDIVECVYGGMGLTVGRRYRVINVSMNIIGGDYYFKVLNDDGDDIFYLSSMFKKVVYVLRY